MAAPAAVQHAGELSVAAATLLAKVQTLHGEARPSSVEWLLTLVPTVFGVWATTSEMRKDVASYIAEVGWQAVAERLLQCAAGVARMLAFVHVVGALCSLSPIAQAKRKIWMQRAFSDFLLALICFIGSTLITPLSEALQELDLAKRLVCFAVAVGCMAALQWYMESRVVEHRRAGNINKSPSVEDKRLTQDQALNQRNAIGGTTTEL